MREDILTSFIFAKSAAGIPIPAYRFGYTGPEILILAAVHGDETEGVVAANGLLEKFVQAFPYHLQITLIPTFNIDGVLAKSRTNSNGVDLNRNMATKDWSPMFKTPRYHPGPNANSEPESRALANYIETIKPKFILSLHSWFPILNVNGDCLDIAKTLQNFTGYKIDTDIGYPTPGCLGTYAGLERSSPVLTYEIERGLNAAIILKTHVPAILESLKTCEAKYV